MDIATLGVRVTSAGVAETTAGLNGLAAAGDKASISAASLARSGATAETITRLTGVSASSAAYAVEKFGVASSGAAAQAAQLATQEQRAASATVELGAAAGTSSLGLGRLRQSMATLAAESLGMNPIFGRLGSTMAGAFGIGSIVVIGVLAGVSAIAYAWKALESDADKFADKVEATMKKAREARSDDQLKDADAQVFAAQKHVADAQRALALAQAGSYGASGAKTGIATVDEADVARQRHLLDQALIDLSDYTTKRSQLQYASSLEGANTEARDLALLVSSNHATAAERQRALDLYRRNEAEIAQLGKSQTDNVRRLALIQDDAALRGALHPTAPASDDNRIAGIADEIKRLHDEAGSFGKDASIDNRVAALVDQLTHLDAAFKQQEQSGKITAAQYAKDAAQITALKTAAEDAGAALRAAADAQVSTSINNQYQAQLQLYNAVIDQTGAYHELTAAKSAQLAISQKEIELGHALSQADREKIEATYRLSAQITEAHTAQEKAQAAAKQQSGQQEKLLEQPFANAIQSIQRATGSFFENLFTPGRNAARQFWDDFKTLAIKTFADILSMDLMEKVLGSSTKGGLASSLAGMLGLSIGHTSTASVIPGVGSVSVISPEQYAGLDAFAKAFPSTAQRVVGQVGEGLGMAGAGFGVGSMIGSFAQSHGLGMVGAGIGGALGGAATGAAIGAMGGPIGIAAGAFIGGVAGAVGGLLGFQHSAAAAAKALLQLQVNEASVSASLADWRAQITGSAADQKAAALEDLRLKYLQEQQTINQLEAGKKQERQRNADLSAAELLYEKQQAAIDKNTAAWEQNTGAINALQGYRYQVLYYGSMPVISTGNTNNTGNTSNDGGNPGGPANTQKGGDLHLTLQLNSKTVSKMVLKDFQNAAKRSSKGDSTQWSTITTVN